MTCMMIVWMDRQLEHIALQRILESAKRHTLHINQKTAHL